MKEKENIYGGYICSVCSIFPYFIWLGSISLCLSVYVWLLLLHSTESCGPLFCTDRSVIVFWLLVFTFTCSSLQFWRRHEAIKFYSVQVTWHLVWSQAWLCLHCVNPYCFIPKPCSLMFLIHRHNGHLSVFVSLVLNVHVNGKCFIVDSQCTKQFQLPQDMSPFIASGTWFVSLSSYHHSVSCFFVKSSVTKW